MKNENISRRQLGTIGGGDDDMNFKIIALCVYISLRLQATLLREH